MCVLVLLAAYLAVLEYNRPHVTGHRLTLDEFVNFAETGRIRSAVILDEDAYVIGRYELEDGSAAAYNLPYLKLGSRERVVDILIDNRVRTDVDQQFGKSLVEPATILLPALLLVVVLVYMVVSYRRGTGLFGIKSGAKLITKEKGHVTFADVAAQDAAVEELREVSEFLTNPDRFTAIGAQIPRGILLYGPPGCGKTLIARALAGEAGASFYSISGSDFIEMYVGVGAARVRDLFGKAREDAPAIVFIDELDSIGARRTSSASPVQHAEHDQALNQILSEMDGFSPAEGIIVVAATNRPDVLDPALLRPGRFDRTIGLEMPNEEGRLAILQLHARGKPVQDLGHLRQIATKAVGMTGADLSNIINEAALLAARAGRRMIENAQLDAALARVQDEPERQKRLSVRDRKVGARSTGERVTFADVAGIDYVIEELSEVELYLKSPERFAVLGARVPRGFLLVGPPGCGKTLVAKALAGQTNAAFLSVAASEFVEIWVGQGAGRVRDLFAEARSMAPAIVFIDEIDALGGHRGTRAGDSGEREQTLNQLLTELDGFKGRDGVIVMAATNRADMLDRALVRPGRFDRQIVFELPDRLGRKQILQVHARGKPLSPDVDLDRTAGMTPGFSGADLENALNEAALIAARRGHARLTAEDVIEGVERAAMGIESRGKVVTEEERRRVAWHEAAHALVGWALPEADPPHKITILPRGQALGYVWGVPDLERHMQSRSGYLDQLAATLAGRVSEELVFGEPYDGAYSDLAKATDIARRMVARLGMSEALGPVGFREEDSYSGATARLIDDEVRKVLQEAYARARSLLVALREDLDALAEALLERETMSAEDLEALLGSREAVRARRARLAG